MREKAPYPHCDSLVLHAPGECRYCDDYPEAQNKRLAEGVNFTGHSDPKKKACPAEARRSRETINRWGGNVARPVPVCLFGSSIFPSTVVLGGREVQLGDIVRRSQGESRLSPEQWNALSAFDRELRLFKTYFDLRDEEAACSRATFVPHDDLRTK